MWVFSLNVLFELGDFFILGLLVCGGRMFENKKIDVKLKLELYY